MVDFLTTPAARQMKRCIEQVRGTVNINQTPTGYDDQVSLDFDIGFPFNPLVDDPNRKGAVRKSSVLIGENSVVHMMTLRMPPVPADTFPKMQIDDTTREVFPLSVGDAEIMIHIEGGTPTKPFTEWWPHIELASATSAPSINEVCTYMNNYVPEYMRVVRERHNEFLDELGKG